MPQGKTVAEDIRDICKLLREDIEQLKKMLGDEAMEPVSRRLSRIEAKVHHIGDGSWKESIWANKPEESGWDRPA